MSFKTNEADILVTPGPNPMGPPSAVIAAGVFSGTLGKGVLRLDISPLAGKGTVEYFTRKGSFRATVVATNAPGPGGVTITATDIVTGGTGIYAHVRGALHVTGFHDFKTNHTATQQTGALTY